MKIAGLALLIIAAMIVLLLVVLAHKQSAPKKYWEKIQTKRRHRSKIQHAWRVCGRFQRNFTRRTITGIKTRTILSSGIRRKREKYPLVVLVNGTGVPCSKYEAVFEHIASWGYVVIGNDYGTNWDGRHPSETLDFALNTEEISRMIDPDKIAIGGHSQGGMGAFNA